MLLCYAVSRDKKIVRVENPQYKMTAGTEAEDVTLGVGLTVYVLYLGVCLL